MRRSPLSANLRPLASGGVMRSAPSLGQRLWRAVREVLGPYSLKDPTGLPTFAGADYNRLLLDWVASLLTADDETKRGFKVLRARARDLGRNNSYAKQYLNLLSVNCVGPDGFGHEAMVRDNSGKLNKRLNDTIEEAWTEWCETVTRDGKQGIVELQQVLLKTVARDGEAFVRLWRDPKWGYGLRLEPVDPDMVDEGYNRLPSAGVNEIRMGVEVDGDAAPVAYYLYDMLTTSTSTAYTGRGRVRVPAADIIHIFDPDRVNQTRGTTWMSSVMVPLKMLDGYEESELVAARIGAAKMGFFQSKGEPEAAEWESQSGEPLTMEANPGTLEQLPVGWEFKEWSPDHPTTAFAEFRKGILRKVATGLGVSYNALASDLEGVNYSSMRSGLLIERDTYRRIQKWWTRKFLAPVYREWMTQALLMGTGGYEEGLRLDSRPTKRLRVVRWTARGWQWVDPVKDITAAIMGIAVGMTSRTRELREQGIRFEEVLEDLADEMDAADEAEVDISGPKNETAPPPAQTPADAAVKKDDAAEGNDPTGDEPTAAAKKAARAVVANRLRGFLADSLRRVMAGELDGGHDG